MGPTDFHRSAMAARDAAGTRPPAVDAVADNWRFRPSRFGVP
jgi:hypothetical protein